MKDLIVLLMHLMATLAKLTAPGGAKAVAADGLLTEQQHLVLSTTRTKSISA